MTKIEKDTVVIAATTQKKNKTVAKKSKAQDFVVINKRTAYAIVVPIIAVLLVGIAVMAGYLVGTAGANRVSIPSPSPKKVVVVLPTSSPEPTVAPIPAPKPSPTPQPTTQTSTKSTSSNKYGRLQRTKDAGESYYESLYFIGGFEMVNLALYTVIPDDHVFAKDDGFTHENALEDKRFKVSGYSGYYTVAEAMELIKPKGVVLCFGYNGAPYMSVSTYTFYFSKLIDDIKEVSPNTKIIIQMLNPITYRAEQVELTKERGEQIGYYTNKKIAAINAALQSIARKKRVYYVATDGVLRLNDHNDAPLNPVYAKEDGQALNREGNERVAEYIREHKLP